MFVDDVYEDLELWYPKLRLHEAGAEVVVAGSRGRRRSTPASTAIPAARTRRSARCARPTFDGLVIPGGFMPDKLRRDPQRAGNWCASFRRPAKLVAAICHGGWIPISAGVYRGVRVTGSPGIKDDLVNAGAVWEDAAVVVDRHFVSSRKPDDLPDFCRAHFAGAGAASGHGQPNASAARTRTSRL